MHADYASTGYSLIIPARQTRVTRSVGISMDNLVESNETFSNGINHINTAGVSAGLAEATVTIVSSQGLSNVTMIVCTIIITTMFCE